MDRKDALDAKLDRATVNKVAKANIANLLKKVKSGRPLTKYESEVIERYQKPRCEPKPGPAEPVRKGRLQGVRWTVEQAAAEFGLNPRTVSSRMKTAGVIPGEDGHFSTMEVHSAICGDLEKEKIRNLQKLNRDLDTGHATVIGELVDVRDFVKRYEPIYAAIRQMLLGSKLPSADVDALLAELAKLHTGQRGPGPDV